MALVSTPAGTNSNSYCSLEQANAYFTDSYLRSSWLDSQNDRRSTALIEATRWLDLLIEWFGYKSTTTQSLMWPRAGVKDVDASARAGYIVYLSDSAIPNSLVVATCELAVAIIEGLKISFEESELSKVKVGSLSVEFADKSAKRGLPVVVSRLLTVLGEYSPASSRSIVNVNLVRV